MKCFYISNFKSFDINLLFADFMLFPKRLQLAGSISPRRALQRAPLRILAPLSRHRSQRLRRSQNRRRWRAVRCATSDVGYERSVLSVLAIQYIYIYMWIIILIWHVTENGAPSLRGVAIVMGKNCVIIDLGMGYSDLFCWQTYLGHWDIETYCE